MRQRTRQTLTSFGLHCQLHTHPHMLSFLRSGCMTLTQLLRATHSLINPLSFSSLKHIFRSSPALVSSFMWPKPRSQEAKKPKSQKAKKPSPYSFSLLSLSALSCSGLFFLQHQKCLRSTAQFPIWQIYWPGLWTFVWAPLTVIPLMSNTHDDTHSTGKYTEPEEQRGWDPAGPNMEYINRRDCVLSIIVVGWN